jgi:hypothetical protein
MKRLLTSALLVLLAGTAHADGLPVEIRGLWAFEPADCSNPHSDGLLKVEANAVVFFASSYGIKRVVRRPDGSLSASGLVSNEGEAGRAPGSLKMKLIASDKLYVLDHRYHRCPKNGRATRSTGQEIHHRPGRIAPQGRGTLV